MPVPKRKRQSMSEFSVRTSADRYVGLVHFAPMNTFPSIRTEHARWMKWQTIHGTTNQIALVMVNIEKVPNECENVRYHKHRAWLIAIFLMRMLHFTSIFVRICDCVCVGFYLRYIHGTWTNGRYMSTEHSECTVCCLEEKKNQNWKWLHVEHKLITIHLWKLLD